MPELVAKLRRENNALKIQLNSLSAQTFLKGPLVNLYTDAPLPAEKNVWGEGVSVHWPASKLSGALWRRAEKGRRACNYVSGIWIPPPIFPVARRRLSCQISTNQREAETSANINKHWKKRAKVNDVTTNVISANQHFPSTFSMPIFKFQRLSCKLSFLFPLSHQSASQSLLAGYLYTGYVWFEADTWGT